MKYGLLFILLTGLLILGACQNSSEKTAATPEAIETNQVVDSADEAESTPRKSNYQNPPEEVSYPDWVIDPSPDSVYTFGGEKSVVEFVEMNDSVAYAIIEIAGPNCFVTLIRTYLQRAPQIEYALQTECDHDESFPHHSWVNFSSMTDHTFHVVQTTRSVKPEMIDEDGYVDSEINVNDIEYTLKVSTYGVTALPTAELAIDTIEKPVEP